ncbi:hypothetical protein K4K54_011689 [Colletotrichum sp. SAR 10_86]|nr:hypothetical protein K4K54_011689 [Colletotrichum sp. SAR 10_86]
MPETRSRTDTATSQELVAQIVTAASDAADARETMDANVQQLWKNLSDTYGEDLPTNANRSKAFRKFVMEEIPDDAIRRVLEVSFRTSFEKNKEVVLLRQATNAFSLETWAVIYLSFGHKVAASRKSLQALNKLKKDCPDATFDNVADVAEDKRKLRLGPEYRPGFHPPMQLADINAAVAFFHDQQNLGEVAETDESESHDEGETGDEEDIGDAAEIDKDAGNEAAQGNEPDVGVIDPTADGSKDKAENIEAKAPSPPIIGFQTGKTSGAGSKLNINLRSNRQQDLQLANNIDTDRDDALHPETGRGGNDVQQGPESQEDLLSDDLSSRILLDASSFEISRLLKNTNDEDAEFNAARIQRELSEALQRGEIRRVKAFDEVINERKEMMGMLKKNFDPIDTLMDSAASRANQAKADSDGILEEFKKYAENALQWATDPAQSQWAVGNGARMDTLTRQQRHAEERHALAHRALWGFKRAKEELEALIFTYEQSLEDLENKKSSWDVIVMDDKVIAGPQIA